jgi:hypothetical protein
VLHGRYSKIRRRRVRELLDHFKSQGNPLDLTDEVHLLRALLTDWVERYDDITNGLHRWHASFQDDYSKAFDGWRQQALRANENHVRGHYSGDTLGPPPDPLDYVNKPRQLLDITAATQLIDRVGRMVERIEKLKSTGTVSLETLDRVLEQVGVETVRVLQEEVSDHASRSAILTQLERRWASIRVDQPHGPRTTQSWSIN